VARPAPFVLYRTRGWRSCRAPGIRSGTRHRAAWRLRWAGSPPGWP